MMTAARKLIYFQSLQNIRFSQLSNGVRSYGVFIMYVFKAIKKQPHFSSWTLSQCTRTLPIWYGARQWNSKPAFLSFIELAYIPAFRGQGRLHTWNRKILDLLKMMTNLPSMQRCWKEVHYYWPKKTETDKEITFFNSSSHLKASLTQRTSCLICVPSAKTRTIHLKFYWHLKCW